MITCHYHWSSCRLLIKIIFSSLLEKLKTIFRLLSFSIAISFLKAFSLVLLRIFSTPHERHQIMILIFFESCQIDWLSSFFRDAVIKKRSDFSFVSLRAQMTGTEVFAWIGFLNHHTLGWIVRGEIGSLCGFFCLVDGFVLEAGIHFSSHTI